jgi:hypothetical protein
MPKLLIDVDFIEKDDGIDKLIENRIRNRLNNLPDDFADERIHDFLEKKIQKIAWVGNNKLCMSQKNGSCLLKNIKLQKSEQPFSLKDSLYCMSFESKN